MHRLNTHAAARGVAMLMALGMIFILTTLVTDFVYQTRVEVEMAYNSWDALQAEYNAWTALRMRALILKQSRQLNALMGGVMQAVQSQGGIKPPPISQILNQLPVECSLLGQIIQNQAESTSSTTKEKNESFFPGDCSASSENEHSKIPINLLGHLAGGRGALIQRMLLGFLSNPGLSAGFGSLGDNKDQASEPLELIRHIMDWIDSDHAEVNALGDEDRYYQYFDPPYRAKNAPLDSVAEVQRIAGINPLIYRFLAPHITIYTAEAGIEVSTAPASRLLLGLLSIVQPNTPLEFMDNAAKVLKGLVDATRASLLPMNVELLKSTLTNAGLMSYVDPKMFSAMFKDGHNVTWHTIYAEGRAGKARVRMRAVFQAAEGSFYYFRQD